MSSFGSVAGRHDRDSLNRRISTSTKKLQTMNSGIPDRPDGSTSGSRSQISRIPHNFNFLTLLILSVLTFCGATAAADQRLHPRLQKIERRDGLLIDTRPMPVAPPYVGLELLKRSPNTAGSADSGLVADTATLTATAAAASTTATTQTTSTGTIVYASASTAGVDNAPAATSLPQVFDSNLGTNFTSTACPNFLNNLKQNSTFQNCYPLSLLLTNSLSFFQNEKSFFSATYALDATCNVNYQQCSTMMASLASQLKGQSVCASDLAVQNPLVEQTYNGLLAYPVLYQAGCLKDSLGNYCFASAVTNTSTASNVYPYYLPLGTPLPSSFKPTCDSCLNKTMQVLAHSASDSSQPISNTYNKAATAVDNVCGANFVPLLKKSSAARSGNWAMSPIALAVFGFAALVVAL